MAKSTTIEALATAVFDNGRRGMPRPGCDCEQCFGYCLTDQDTSRQNFSNGITRGNRHERLAGAALNFDE